jgi:hypothetical protein
MHVAVVLMVKTQVAEQLVYFETYWVTEFLQESICRDVHCVLKLLGSMNVCSDSVCAICPCFDGGWSLSTLCTGSVCSKHVVGMTSIAGEMQLEWKGQDSCRSCWQSCTSVLWMLNLSLNICLSCCAECREE